MVSANTAYYIADAENASLELRTAVDTSIDATLVEKEIKFYDLKGNLVEKPVRGIYVTSEGKKVFVF